MTLVIAHRLNNRISLSSDSRISFGNAGHIDYGIKVFSVLVKIYSPTSSETNNTNLDYNYKLGLAVVGSAINAYTVKESVYEILQNLQYIPGHTDLSMVGIASLVFKVFNKTTLDLGDIIQVNGICELILAGYCPIQNKIRIFKFSCDTSTHPIRPFHEEILTENGIEFFGSGKNEADRIHTQNANLSPLHIIRQVIRDGNVVSVGGGLQYGEFVINNFTIYGVEDYVVNDDGTFKEYLYTLRGINLYKEEFERGDDGFHVAYTFKRPFEQEINNIWRQQGIE
ncbi:hypothetical protein [Chryseobacterium caseinilyticum]|uniref:FHA domain-containing protein n=1 Tax=Chryseobacterium caseinilyticum TaxID=2771428 RepID=A0ABR8ZIC3_9FLAO|nr:hypothetical protein [Chryseobacterium caseinilyticum]MBD8084655.1 hypothetical protein [Chryseobacterium caseinilyticum]